MFLSERLERKGLLEVDFRIYIFFKEVKKCDRKFWRPNLQGRMGDIWPSSPGQSYDSCVTWDDLWPRTRFPGHSYVTHSSRSAATLKSLLSSHTYVTHWPITSLIHLLRHSFMPISCFLFTNFNMSKRNSKPQREPSRSKPHATTHIITIFRRPPERWFYKGSSVSLGCLMDRPKYRENRLKIVSSLDLWLRGERRVVLDGQVPPR